MDGLRKPIDEKTEYLKTEGDVIDTKKRTMLQLGDSHCSTFPKSWLRRIAVSLNCEIEDLEPGFYFVKPADSGFWDSYFLIKFNKKGEET